MAVGRLIAATVLFVTTLGITVTNGPSVAGTTDCTASTTTTDAFVTAELECITTPDPAGRPDGPSDLQNDLSIMKWVPTCPSDPESARSCITASGCPEGEAPWHRIGNQFGEWVVVDRECRTTNSPTITPAAVATAFRRIPLPELRSVSQPAAKTLVNFDTIFYVDAETLDRSIRLLGQEVDLRITPSSFRWTFGDGTERVTTTPGHAYPAKTVTHRYERAHVTVEHHVEVIWTATWRVNGGPWRDVPGSVTIAGPSTPLRIAEAVPLLSSTEH